MRRLFALFAAGLASAAWADDPKPKADPPARPAKAEPTLKVGDKAPPLKADRWLQGAEVKGFEPGKVYVVEFWQTWCGPCIVAMPHLADLAEEYKPKGVTVVGFAGVLGRDTTEKITEFVKTKGPKLGYTFAHTPDKVVTDAWMTAAGQNGIPCSFVVDQKGRIAYIGHPMTLDPVLPLVAAGKWDADKATELTAAYRKDLTAGQRAASTARTPSQAAEGLKTLGELVDARPELAAPLAAAKLSLLVKAERYTEAAAAAEAAIGKATRRGDGAKLTTLAGTLAAANRPELAALAVKAADTNLAEAGAANVPALLTAHQAYTAAGQPDKAKGFAGKAVRAAQAAADKAEAAKSPTAFTSLLTLADAHKAAGDKAKAKAAAQKALDTAPKQYQQLAAQRAKPHGAEPKADDDKSDK